MESNLMFVELRQTIEKPQASVIAPNLIFKEWIEHSITET